MNHWITPAVAVAALLLASTPGLADEFELTRWSEDLEWFIEAEELAAGSTRTFYVHMTWTSDYRPVTGGQVTLELRDALGTPVASGMALATRPGIFPVSLQLPDPGRYALFGRHEGPQGLRDSRLGVLDIRAGHRHAADEHHDHEHGIRAWFGRLFRQDHGHEHEDDHGHEHGHEHGSDAELITFLKETQWGMNFAVVPVRFAAFAERIEVPGTVREAPGARTQLIAPAGGVVTSAQAWPHHGQRVEHGEEMLRLTLLPDSGMASGLALDLARARERLTAAEANLERLSALAAEGVVAESRVLEARRESNTARAELEDARARQARLGGTADPDAISLRSPAPGRVENLEVMPGEVVQAGQRLATVLDNSRLWLVAHLYPADLERVTALADPAVRLPGSRDWHLLNGTAAWESGEFGGPGQTLEVAFELPQDQARYRPGMPVTVSLATGPASDRILVPRQALIDDDGIAVVIVQSGGESFERRAVRTGLRATGQVEILAGLEPGERVVIEGAWAVLLAGRDSDAAGHGHAH